MMEIIAYIKTHGAALLGLSYLLVLGLDFVSSLTPTKKDDLFSKRVSAFHARLLAFFKIPNIKREGGSIVLPSKIGKHKAEDVGEQ